MEFLFFIEGYFGLVGDFEREEDRTGYEIEIDESLPSLERLLISFFSKSFFILGETSFSFLGRLETGEMVSVDRSFLLDFS